MGRRLLKVLGESFWVFRSFGFKAGITYLWDSLKRASKPKTKKRIVRFEDLSDDDAFTVAWSFGIFRWTNREDLNRQWNAFKQNILH